MEKTLFRPEYRILLGLIRQARRDSGLTQEQIAEKLAMPRSTIAKWETGQQRMDLLEYCSYCEGIEVDPVVLLSQFRAATTETGSESSQ